MSRKPMPLYILIPLDALLLGGSLVTFAFFHHVMPRVWVDDIEQLQQSVIPGKKPASEESVPVPEYTGTTFSTTMPDFMQTTESVPGVSGTSTTADNGATSTSRPVISGMPIEMTDDTDTTTSASTTTTTTALQYDLSGWGAKWPTYFSLGNDVEITSNMYRSHDVLININTLSYGDSNCHVADIYVRNVENFQFAFANDVFATGVAEYAPYMTERHNAILAINGDYYGVRDSGVVVRDRRLYRDVARSDVAALYYDGVVRTFNKEEFDVQNEMNQGIWHTFAFGPNLVRSGVVQGNFTQSTYTKKEARSGFGYYEPGHYCFAVVDGRGMGGSAGLTAEEFANMFAALGCVEAYNLDGGKSSQLIFNNQVYNQPVGYNGSVESLHGLTDIYYIGEVQ